MHSDSAGRSRGGSLGAVLIVVAAVCFGTLGPLSRFAEEAGVGALGLVAWRSAVGAACMALFLLVRGAIGRRSTFSLRDLSTADRWVLVGAAAANAVLNLAVFAAFLRISIALTLLVFYLYPAYVAVASALWFGDRLDRTRWLALGISLAGVVLVVAGAGDLGELDLIGIGLAFVAGVMQTFYMLAARHWLAAVPGPQAAAMTMGGAAFLYLLLALGAGQSAAIAQPLASADALWPVLLAGTVGAGIPTVAYIVGIRLMGAPRAAILATLEPVVGVSLAALLLHEQPGVLQLVGGIFIIPAAVLLQVGGRGDLAEHEAVAERG
ncbi:MAG: DMT family transporter [Chloroflexota bacterium]|nr:DMT family transporter [Chloroflexota bacterium]